MPVSPGQGPFFALLQESPQDGLRLVRGIVEHATQWHREGYAEERRAFPVMTIPFPEGAKSFAGDFGIYQWARGGTGALVAASALMALEAWAHRQIEGGRRAGEVLQDVLGPSGSSVAFVCVAVDLVLSHWPAMKEVRVADAGGAGTAAIRPHAIHPGSIGTWADFSRRSRNRNIGPSRPRILLARPSRQRELIDKAGDYAMYGPADIHAKLREALVRARDRVAQARSGRWRSHFRAACDGGTGATHERRRALATCDVPSGRWPRNRRAPISATAGRNRTCVKRQLRNRTRISPK